MPPSGAPGPAPLPDHPSDDRLTSRAHVHLLVNGRMLVLGELPDPWTLAGTALIVLAGLYVLRRVR